MVSHPRWSSPQVCPSWASLRPCWKKGAVPQDMNDATIRLCKNKGDLSDCNSYRGIYLLSIVGTRLRAPHLPDYKHWLTAAYTPGFQRCFRLGRSTTDMPSIPAPTVNSSTWLAFAPRRKSKLHVTCSSLTMLLWKQTPTQQCRDLSTNLLVHVKPLFSHSTSTCDCPGCQPSLCNQNRRSHSRCSRRIHPPRFHHLHVREPHKGNSFD